MPNYTIDRDKLHRAVRHMGEEYFYCLLDDAIDLISQEKLARLIKGYFHPDKLRPDAKPLSVAEKVNRFRDASHAGEYYEEFDVNSKNCDDTSVGTRAWFSECRRLFYYVASDFKNMASHEALSAFDVLFGLLDDIDECSVEILFFGDEGGAYQVPVDWETVFPAYFECLSQNTTPHEYAQRAIALISQRGTWGREAHFAAAKQWANPEEKVALENAEQQDLLK
ncbi:MAG: hypothetical protein JXX14_14170 [Deltaproteobacteria bacterium]|nr:hypothetical protein [Deltaproteobacteria bacterium]